MVVVAERRDSESIAINNNAPIGLVVDNLLYLSERTLKIRKSLRLVTSYLSGTRRSFVINYLALYGTFSWDHT
jgi:hypothetical protein